MGPDRNTHLRNFAILILIAVAVWQLPGGGTATATINNVLGLIFAGGIVFLGYRMYMEHRSTLFMLVSAFCGLETMRSAYSHAIETGYRFYSYGDACLLFRAEE